MTSAQPEDESLTSSFHQDLDFNSSDESDKPNDGTHLLCSDIQYSTSSYFTASCMGLVLGYLQMYMNTCI